MVARGAKGVGRLWLSLHVYINSYQRYFASICLTHQPEHFWLKREKLIWSWGTEGFHSLSSSNSNSVPVQYHHYHFLCVFLRTVTAGIHFSKDLIKTFINVLTQFHFIKFRSTRLSALINNLLKWCGIISVSCRGLEVHICGYKTCNASVWLISVEHLPVMQIEASMILLWGTI